MTTNPLTKEEVIYERIKPKMDEIRARYPDNIDGLEPALTSDVAEVIKWYIERWPEEKKVRKEYCCEKCFDWAECDCDNKNCLCHKEEGEKKCEHCLDKNHNYALADLLDKIGE